MSESQNINNNTNFGSLSNNQNRTSNQNLDNLRERLNQFQINNETEEGNTIQNIDIGVGNIPGGVNPIQENQTLGNNNALLSSQNISLHNTENEMYEEYNFFPGQTSSEHNNLGLFCNEEFINFPGEAYHTTENNEDRLSNFDSSNYSTNSIRNA